MGHAGIARHAAGERLARHRHAEGYVAVVLAGSYEEAGESGRLTARCGMAVVHYAHAAHQDWFGAAGAHVLNLPGSPDLPEGPGTITDPDAVARAAERDTHEALALVRENFRPLTPETADWPDLLAATLRRDTSTRLHIWADEMGLDRASVSRGFARAYGISPKRFRLEERARRAALALPGWRGGLADMAAAFGFADQAHLCRAVRALTGLTPGEVRAKSVQ